jgi:two-component system, OmpR family, sensor histidine kinase KdpD
LPPYKDNERGWLAAANVPFDMTYQSPDPEQLLRQVQAEEAYERRGLLKVFLGYASGVGKSLRMLDEARRRKERGEDVIVGATQSVASPQVEALLQKMEVIPLQFICGVQAMDVEAILRRRPQVCVVDGLAYGNPPTCRHSERWEDVEELLAAGISILASVNLQYIDEYKEKVEKITGKAVAEVVPLDFLRSAEEIEVVDAPSEETFQSEVENPGEAGSVRDHQVVVQQQKLGELREMALLLTADIVDHQLETYLQRHGIEQLWGTQERVLVCVKAGVDAHKMIESGRRNADRFHGELYVVNVRPGEHTSKEELALEENLQYARTLGAQVEVLEEKEWTSAVLRFAHDRRVTQIFIHHTRNEGWLERLFGSSVDRLIRSAEGIDIRVFPQ